MPRDVEHLALTAAGDAVAPVTVRRFTGTASEFHERDPHGNAGAELWVFDVDRPAIVLGSRQSDDLLDLDACERAGVEVVRRRSGGGVVLLRPAEVCWVDIVLPRGGPGWTDDVVVAMRRCGEAWRHALEIAGQDGDDGRRRLAVHDGPLERGPVAEAICFGGLGPGEVTAGGAKLVGISQRRTRDVARFQCVVHRRWEPRLLLDLLACGVVDPAAVIDLDVATSEVDEAALIDALATVLPGTI